MTISNPLSATILGLSILSQAWLATSQAVRDPTTPVNTTVSLTPSRDIYGTIVPLSPITCLEPNNNSTTPSLSSKVANDLVEFIAFFQGRGTDRFTNNANSTSTTSNATLTISGNWALVNTFVGWDYLDKSKDPAAAVEYFRVFDLLPLLTKIYAYCMEATQGGGKRIGGTVEFRGIDKTDGKAASLTGNGDTFKLTFKQQNWPTGA